MQTTGPKAILYRILHSSGEFFFHDIETAREQLLMMPGAKLFIVEA